MQDDGAVPDCGLVWRHQTQKDIELTTTQVNRWARACCQHSLQMILASTWQPDDLRVKVKGFRQKDDAFKHLPFVLCSAWQSEQATENTY